MSTLTVSRAAQSLGVSYAALKQWIYAGKVRAARTPGGHYRIAPSEIKRLRDTSGSGPQISGRNKLRGRVVRLEKDRLLASVTLDVGGQQIQAVITRAALEELALKKGDEATALIKATEVMIMR